MLLRGVAQFGRALRSGRRGRKFESCRLDFVRKHKCWNSSAGRALHADGEQNIQPGFVQTNMPKK